MNVVRKLNSPSLFSLDVIYTQPQTTFNKLWPPNTCRLTTDTINVKEGCKARYDCFQTFLIHNDNVHGDIKTNLLLFATHTYILLIDNIFTQSEMP